MKITGLVPCLMQDNNREVNMKYLSYAKDKYHLDNICVYAQCFKESDYLNGFQYIGNKDTKQGFIVPRNELLKEFYNSDYDYAIWFDANEYCSGSTINDLVNVVEALKSGELDINCIVSTMGIQVSTERRKVKSDSNYFEKVTLHQIPFTRGTLSGYYTMHGMIIKNFKKYYNQELYIDERCDPWKGTSEDTYFAMLLRGVTECYLAPAIVFSKASANTSTWMSDKGSYAYPPVETDIVISYVQENIQKHNIKIPSTNQSKYILLDRKYKDNIDKLAEFKARPRKKKDNSLVEKRELF